MKPWISRPCRRVVSLNVRRNRFAAGPWSAFGRCCSAIVFALASIAGQAFCQNGPRDEAPPRAADLQAIAKALRESPAPQDAASHLPALIAALDDDAVEALPLVEQAIERSAPGAIEGYYWPAVAAALKAAARARYEQVETAKAGAHLKAMLAIYREVASARRRDADALWRWLKQIHEVAAEYLRGDQTAEALAVLAEGADLDLPYREELDDGRAALAGALNRRLAQLSGDERYELLHDWSLPTESRRAVRVFSSLAPVEAPPSVFARALGERPRADSFPIAEIGGVRGLFSTAWTLVAAAAETGRLRRLTAELQQAADQKVPHADFVLLLARVAAADGRYTEQSEKDRLAADVLKFADPAREASQADETMTNGRSSRLSVLMLAAACLTNADSALLGESALDSLVRSAPQPDPERLTPIVRRALAAATVKRFSDAAPRLLDDPNLELWIPASLETADDAARAAVRAAWLAHEEHFLHLAGPRYDFLCFRYPLTGNFEFQIEAQDGGAAQGGVVFGGLAFESSGAQFVSRVGNVDLGKELVKSFPFVRQERWPTFQRLAIRAAGGAMQYRCNGRPVWNDVPAGSTSPWLALRSDSERTAAFRGLRIVGEPVIPREVRLTDGDSLRGWFSGYYPTAIPTAVQLPGGPAALARAPEGGYDWFAEGGVIHGAHRPRAAAAAPSRLSYFRPLADGETIDYEFFYEPGQCAVHPALGRLAFVLEPTGVQVHWLTAVAGDWTGLSATNSVAEPLNRRGPKPLPLKVGEWNRATLSLSDATASIALNGTAIYLRKLEPENPRTFSFYHDRRLSAARIRNVALRGDWPERFSEGQLARLTAPRDADRARRDREAIGVLFGERHAPDSALYVHRRAKAMRLEARYAMLSDWVLPGVDHAGLRLALDYAPLHPSPPVAEEDPADAARPGETRVQTGGNLVSPALDLVEAARQLGKLDELRRRVEQAPEGDEAAQRARLAMLAVVDVARQEPKTALESLDKLLTLLESSTHTSFIERWPETLATHAALDDPATRNAGRDLAYHLLLRQVRNGADSGSEAWRRQMGALARMAQHFEEDVQRDSAEGSGAARKTPQWFPASRTTAQTRGLGYPPHRWDVSEARAAHLVSHHQDYLYFQSPLRGDFEAEYDVPGFGWRDTMLVIGGWWTSPIYDHKSYAHGTYRGELPRTPIAPPLTRVGPLIHARTVVRGGVSRTYANGRLLHEQPLLPQRDPWIAIRNIERAAGGAENVRMIGRPEIPEEICLTDLEGLTGWFAYYDGMPGGPAAWQPQGDLTAGGEAVGRRQPDLAGLFAENLFRYHRPMFEDGVIEYEFYYCQGEIACHPALDRLAFLLEPAGVRIHWITDGAYDRTSLGADNVFDEPANRRGPERMPLKSDAWNRLALEVKGDLVELRLNGQPIYERKLEPTNQRTFGLFHYADQTDAVVRRVMWRGQWPRELPPVAQQELAGGYSDILDARLPELKAKFEHDFVRAGAPAERFSIAPMNAYETLSPQGDGLHIAFAGGAGYRNSAVAPRLTVGGDFDAIISYERFQGTPTNKGAISLMLMAKTDDPAASDCIVFRRASGREDGGIDQIIHTTITRRQGDGVRNDFSRTEAFEATSGRLRLARRGDTMYFLTAEGDSPNFRIVRTEKVAADDVRSGGLRFMTQTKEGGAVDVVWKNLTVCAERLSGPAMEDAAQIVAELDRQRDALAGSFVHDFVRDGLTIERFHHWNWEPPAKPQPGGLRVVARGTDPWTAAGAAPHLALRGDFDISVEVDEFKFDRAKAGQNAAMFLTVDLAAEQKQICSVVFMADDAGRSQALVEMQRQKADGGFEYISPHQESASAVQRMRLARRGKQLFWLYSPEVTRRDRLLGHADASDVDLADTCVQLRVHAGGAGRAAEACFKQLNIRAERIALPPDALPAKTE